MQVNPLPIFGDRKKKVFEPVLLQGELIGQMFGIDIHNSLDESQVIFFETKSRVQGNLQTYLFYFGKRINTEV